MNFVQPVREKEKIDEIKTELKKSGYRDYLLFVTGINTGLRISDLIKLKVKDVRNNTHVIITEQKTGKQKRFLINPNLTAIMNEYIKNLSDEEYIFKSRQGCNKPITRVQAYRIINNAVRKSGVADQVGTHTLRKTFGYHHYQLYKDIAVLQDIFNHSAPSITLRYIGINDDMKDKTIENFVL